MVFLRYLVGVLFTLIGFAAGASGDFIIPKNASLNLSRHVYSPFSSYIGGYHHISHHVSHLDTVIIITVPKSIYWHQEISDKNSRLIVKKSYDGWLIQNTHGASSSMDGHIRNMQLAEWPISTNVFRKCNLEGDSLQAVATFLNFTFSCHALMVYSSNGALLAKLKYPKNHIVTGIYISYDQGRYSSYFSFHDDQTYKSYRSFFNPAFLAYDDEDEDDMPIILPAPMLNNMAQNPKWMLVPFSGLGYTSFDDEDFPIIIPNIQ